MNGAPHGPCAFPMDDPDLQYPLFQAYIKVIRNQILYLSGLECVQVQDSVYFQFNGFEFVHVLVGMVKGVLRSSGSVIQCGGRVVQHGDVEGFAFFDESYEIYTHSAAA